MNKARKDESDPCLNRNYKESPVSTHKNTEKKSPLIHSLLELEQKWITK
jgi:hypothetical protein